MALGSVLSQTFEEKSNKSKKEKKDAKKEKLATSEDIKVGYIDRCKHTTCQKCRKHKSCIQRPREDCTCPSFEEGLAWDHNCLEYDDED